MEKLFYRLLGGIERNGGGTTCGTTLLAFRFAGFAEFGPR
jgi:hypothetical protein